MKLLLKPLKEQWWRYFYSTKFSSINCNIIWIACTVLSFPKSRTGCITGCWIIKEQVWILVKNQKNIIFHELYASFTLTLCALLCDGMISVFFGYHHKCNFSKKSAWFFSRLVLILSFSESVFWVKFFIYLSLCFSIITSKRWKVKYRNTKM